MVVWAACHHLPNLSWSQGADGESSEAVRHADTPELAREALVDSAALIFKGQVLFTNLAELVAWVDEWPSSKPKKYNSCTSCQLLIFACV